MFKRIFKIFLTSFEKDPQTISQEDLQRLHEGAVSDKKLSKKEEKEGHRPTPMFEELERRLSGEAPDRGAIEQELEKMKQEREEKSEAEREEKQLRDLYEKAVLEKMPKKRKKRKHGPKKNKTEGAKEEQRPFSLFDELEKRLSKEAPDIEAINKEIKKIEKEREKTEKSEVPRQVAEVTLARVRNFQDLWAKTEQEGDEKFIQKTKELWKEFAVHGVMGIDKESGEKTILNFTDLDGRCSLNLLKLAGINTQDIKFIASGEFVQGRINLDTGDRHGVAVEDEGKTAFFDHHGDKSGNDTSATKITYEALIASGLLKKEEHLDKLVEFVTYIDNRTYPEEEKYFKDSWQTILGLQRFIKPNHLLDFFKTGRSPTEFLSDEDLKKFGLKQKSREQKDKIEASLKRLEEMEEEGLIIQSERYGRIAVDIGKKIPAGVSATKAHGCGGYIIWSPEEKSFFVSTTKPLTDRFSQGKKIRETMWMKPRHDKDLLTATLQEVLNKMTDDSLQAEGELKKFLEGEKEERREELKKALEDIESSPEAKEKAGRWSKARGILPKVFKGIGWAALFILCYGLVLGQMALEKATGVKQSGVKQKR